MEPTPTHESHTMPISPSSPLVATLDSPDDTNNSACMLRHVAQASSEYEPAPVAQLTDIAPAHVAASRQSTDSHRHPLATTDPQHATPSSDLGSDTPARRPTKQYFVELRIRQRPVLALVDLGASTSVVSENLLQTLVFSPYAPFQFTPPKALLMNVENKPIGVMGCTHIDLQFGSQTITHEFHVVPHAFTDLIIGADLTGSNQPIQINTANLTLTANGIPFKLHEIYNDNSTDVSVCQPTTIKQLQSQAIRVSAINAQSQSKLVPGSSVLFTPSDDAASRYGFTPGVYRVNHNLTIDLYLQFDELTDEIILQPSQPIGEVSTPKAMICATSSIPFEDVTLPTTDETSTAASVASFRKRIQKHLPPGSTKRRNQLEDLLTQFHAIFPENAELGGPANVASHSIDTGDSKPIKTPSRRFNPVHEKIIFDFVEDYMKRGLVRRVNSPWAAPVVLVSKKDGTTRFCVDYRRLNAITRKDAFPLPRIDTLLDKLSKAKYFSTLDLLSGFHQLPMDPKDIDKTAFSTPFGLFAFLVMPFGLCNAPSTFQRAMTETLDGLIDDCCLVYIDDIMIFSNTWDEHMTHLELVFKRLESKNLRCKLDKCHFAQREVKYLGHIVSEKGVSPDPSLTEKIRNYPIPKDLHQLRTFLGLSGFYRRFIDHYSHKAEPLIALTRKDVKYEWTPDCQSAFDKLKYALISPPVLIYPDFTKRFILYTDASTVAMGAVLAQVSDVDQQVHPVAFWSKTFNPSQRNWTTSEQECAAIITAIRQFDWCLHSNFDVVTDHSALVWLLNQKTPPTPRLARWITFIQQYQFGVSHRPGKQHADADAMSRAPFDTEPPSPLSIVPITDLGPSPSASLPILNIASTTSVTARKGEEQETETEEQKIETSYIAIDSIHHHQRADPSLQFYFDYFEKDISPASPSPQFNAEVSHMFIDENKCLRYLTTRTDIEPNARFVVPYNLRKAIIKQTHDSVLGGHYGIGKTVAAIRKTYFWPNMDRDISDYIKACDFCSRFKPRRQPKIGLLQPLEPVSEPFDTLAVDVAGPFDGNPNSKRYLVVFIDYYTSWIEAFAVRDTKSTTIANLLIDHVISRHGCPRVLISDQGSNFISEVAQDVYKALNIEKRQTTAYHPQTNGKVEHANGSIKTSLAIYCAQHSNTWHSDLPLLLYAYRQLPHAITGLSPFEMLYARQPYSPLDRLLLLNKNDYVSATSQDYLQHLRDRFTKIQKHVRDKVVRAQSSQKAYYDRKRTHWEFKEDDLVYLERAPSLLGKPTLEPYRFGPYRVIKVHSSLIYNLADPYDASVTSGPVHVSRLSRCPLTWQDLLRQDPTSRSTRFQAIARPPSAFNSPEVGSPPAHNLELPVTTQDAPSLSPDEPSQASPRSTDSVPPSSIVPLADALRETALQSNPKEKELKQRVKKLKKQESPPPPSDRPSRSSSRLQGKFLHHITAFREFVTARAIEWANEAPSKALAQRQCKNLLNHFVYPAFETRERQLIYKTIVKAIMESDNPGDQLRKLMIKWHNNFDREFATEVLNPSPV